MVSEKSDNFGRHWCLGDVCGYLFYFHQPDRWSNSTDWLQAALVLHRSSAVADPVTVPTWPLIRERDAFQFRSSAPLHVFKHPPQHTLDHHHIAGRNPGACRYFKPLCERNDTLDEALALPRQFNNDLAV
jgi:hypothetical protein